MKLKRVVSAMLAFTMAFSSLQLAYADEASDLVNERLAQIMSPKSEFGVFSFDTNEIVAKENEGAQTPITINREGTKGDVSVVLRATDVNATYGEDYEIIVDGKPLEKIASSFSTYDMLNPEISETLDVQKFIEQNDVEYTKTDEDSLEALQQKVTSGNTQVQLQDETVSGSSLALKSAETVLEFADGESSKEITLHILDDKYSEYDENFSLYLTKPSKGIVYGNDTINCTIKDDEPTATSMVSFERETYDGASEITLTRAGNLASAAMVDVYINGVAYGTVDFKPYQDLQAFEATGRELSLRNFVGCSSGSMTEAIVTEFPEDSVASGSAITNVGNISAINQPSPEEVISNVKSETEAVTIEPEVFKNMADSASALPGTLNLVKAVVENTVISMPDKLNAQDDDQKYFYMAPQDLVDVNSHCTEWKQVNDRGDWWRSGTHKLLPAWFVTTHVGGEKPDATLSSYVLPSLMYSNLSIYGYNENENEDDNYYGIAISAQKDGRGWENYIARNEKRGGLKEKDFNLFLDIPMKNEGHPYNFYSKVYVNNTHSGHGGTSFTLHGMRLTKRAMTVQIIAPDGLNYLGEDKPFVPGFAVERFTSKYADYDKDSISIDLDHSGNHGFKVVGYSLCTREVKGGKEIFTPKKNILNPENNGTKFEFTTKFLQDNLDCINIVNTSTEPVLFVKPLIEKTAVNLKINQVNNGTLAVKPEMGINKHYVVGEKGAVTTVDQKGYFNGDTVYFDAKATTNGYYVEGVHFKAAQNNSTNSKEWMQYNGTGDRPYSYQLSNAYTDFTIDGSFTKEPNQIYFDYPWGENNYGTPPNHEFVKNADLAVGAVYAAQAKPQTLTYSQGHIVSKWVPKNGRNKKTYYGNTFYVQAGATADENAYNFEFKTYNGSSEGFKEAPVTIKFNVKQAISKMQDGYPRENGVKNAEGAVVTMNPTQLQGSEKIIGTGTADKDGNVTLTTMAIKPGTNKTVTYTALIQYEGMQYIQEVTLNGNKYSGDTYSETQNAIIKQFGANVPSPASFTVFQDGTPNKNSTVVLKSGSVVDMKLRLATISEWKVQAVKFNFYNDKGKLVSTDTVDYKDNELVTLTKKAEQLSQSNQNLKVQILAYPIKGGPTQLVNFSEMDCNMKMIPPPNPELIDMGIPDTPKIEKTDDLDFIGRLLPEIKLESGALGVSSKRDPETKTYEIVCQYEDTPEPDTWKKKKEKYDKSYKKFIENKEIDTAKKKGGNNTETSYTDKKADIKPVVSFGLKWYYGYDSLILVGVKVYLGVSGSLFAAKTVVTPVGIPAFLRFDFKFQLGCFLDCVVDENYKKAEQKGINLEVLFDKKAESHAFSSFYIMADKADITLSSGLGLHGILSFSIDGTMKNVICWAVGKGVGGKYKFGVSLKITALIFKAEWKMLETEWKPYGTEGIVEEYEKKRGELTNEEPLPSYYDNSGFGQFEVEDVLSNNTPPATLKTNETILLNNGVYYDGAPRIIELGNNKKAVIAVVNNSSADKFNSLTAAYDYYDGSSWSGFKYLQPSEATNTMDAQLRAYDLGDKVGLSWIRSSELQSAYGASVANALHSTEIYTAFMDKTNGTVSDITKVGGDKFAKSDAVLMHNNTDNKIYAYFKSSQFDADKNPIALGYEVLKPYETFAYKVWDETTSSWKDDYTANDTSYKDMAEELGGEKFVTLNEGESGSIVEMLPYCTDKIYGQILVIDADGDQYNTPEDQAVYARVINPITKEPTNVFRLSAEGVCANNIRVENLEDKNPVVFWLEGNEIKFRNNFVSDTSKYDSLNEVSDDLNSNDINSVAAVWDNSNNQLYTSLNVTGGCHLISGGDYEINASYDIDFDKDGSVVAVWQAISDNYSTGKTENPQARELYAFKAKMLSDGKLESASPVMVTEYDQVVGAPSVILDGNTVNTVLVRYNYNAEHDPVGNTISLFTFDDNTVEADLGSINISNEAPHFGDTVAITVPVVNKGLEKINNYSLELYINDTLYETRNSDFGLSSGSKTLESFEYTIPNDFAGADVKAVVTVPNAPRCEKTARIEAKANFDIDIVNVNAIYGTKQLEVDYAITNKGTVAGNIPFVISGDSYKNESGIMEINGSNYGANDRLYTMDYENIAPGASVTGKAIITPKELDAINCINLHAYTSDASLIVEAEDYYAHVEEDEITTESTTEATTNSTTTTETTTKSSGGGSHKATIVNGGEIVKDATTEATTAVEADKTTGFNDITGLWAESYIKIAVEKGYIVGYPDNSFRPNNSLTRAEFVSMIYKMADHSNDTVEKSSFEDVEANSWYATYVDWATAHSIISGYGDNTFRGNSYITREEMAVVIDKFAQYADVDLATENVVEFKDEADISTWAKASVDNLTKAGILVGDNNGNFNPRNNVKRSETAVVVSQF